jgi:PIN domain nuclease of toxin-antitoxin system
LVFAIREALGGLQLPSDPGTFVLEQIELNSFSPPAVSVEHTLRVLHLPSAHRDPFDRLLAAQRLAEKTALVTRDPVFKRYAVAVQW